MPGYNHSSNCPCGWCMKSGGSASRPRIQAAKPIPTYESLLIPNAVCPVCGASVYFYQSPFGGRVFFDDLGPPWPKHPCTSTEFTSWRHQKPQKINLMVRKPQWKRDGWIPLHIKSVTREDEWWVVKAVRIDTRDFVRLLTFERLSLRPESLTFFSGWDSNQVGTLSGLSLVTPVTPFKCRVWSYSRYVYSSPTALSRDDSP